MDMKKFVFFLFVLFSTLKVTSKIEMPTMGWSSWNTYGLNISDSLVRVQADAIVQKGLLRAGYNYINIDGGYFGGRDAQGLLFIHPTRFPLPMRDLVDYIHSKGLKAGIYSDAGANTCSSMFKADSIGIGVGMYHHYEQDTRLFFRDWDFDFIKVDYCGGQQQNLDEEETYRKIQSAILKSGKKNVLLNICRWAYPGTWVSQVALSWRTTYDINASWKSVKSIISQNLYLSAYTGGGHYNDLDMLEVGRGLSEEEDGTHFGIWCMMSSPLLIGCDMATISDKTLALISNPELIALNQDALGLQAEVVKKEGETYVFAKDLHTLQGNCRAVALYNPSNTGQTITVSFASDLCLAGKVKVRNLFDRKEEGLFEGTFKVNVPAHATRIYKMEGARRREQTKYEAETAWLKMYQELRNDTTTARSTALPAASGERVVSYLGQSANNYMEWKRVYAVKAGTCKLIIGYACQNFRDLSVTVNGNTQYLKGLTSGSPEHVSESSVVVHLKKGNNLIRLSNATSWAPNIDYIRFER